MVLCAQTQMALSGAGGGVALWLGRMRCSKKCLSDALLQIVSVTIVLRRLRLRTVPF